MQLVGHLSHAIPNWHIQSGATINYVQVHGVWLWLHLMSIIKSYYFTSVASFPAPNLALSVTLWKSG